MKTRSLLDSMPKGSSSTVLRSGEILTPVLNRVAASGNAVRVPEYLRQEYETPSIEKIYPGRIYVAHFSAVFLHQETGELWITGRREVEQCDPSSWTEESLEKKVLIQKIPKKASDGLGVLSLLGAPVIERHRGDLFSYVVDLRYAGREPYYPLSWSDDGYDSDFMFTDLSDLKLTPIQGAVMRSENDDKPILLSDPDNPWIEEAALTMVREIDGTIMHNYEEADSKKKKTEQPQ